MSGRLVQGRFASGQVQLSQFFYASESLFGQTENDIEMGFVHCGDLFNGQHEKLLKGVGKILHTSTFNVAAQHDWKYRVYQNDFKSFLLPCSKLESAF
jgi:hypothetical protein